MTPPKSPDSRTFNQRSPLLLGEDFDKRLLAYAAAATAAGVGMLALPQSAEAKIVYRPVHKVVQLNHAVPIDLNRSGVHDFDVFNRTHNSTTPFGDYLAAEPLQSGNQMMVGKTSRGFANYALALAPGVRVGPGAKSFAAGRNWMAFRSSGTGTRSGGPWKNVSKHYLGLKFLIDGKAHYGWARLNVSISGQNVSATLTGYAYETVPNTAIVTGKTKSDAALGELARGK